MTSDKIATTSEFYRAIADANFVRCSPEREIGCKSDEVIAVLSDATFRLANDAIHHHRDYKTNALTLLIPTRDLPHKQCRKDSPVENFIISGPWINNFLRMNVTYFDRLTYDILHAALSRRYGFVDVRVHHKLNQKLYTNGTGKSVDVIIPHRGNSQHLYTSIFSIIQQTHRGQVTVCFDQKSDPDVVERFRNDASVNLFEINPHPSGPYVPRQHFGLLSEADYLAFQDSDDYALAERIKMLLACCEAEDADIVGCHELRLDEIERRVIPIRFPSDVNRALKTGIGHVQLFPTALIRTSMFRNLGGLSTAYRFGADRHLQLRASIKAKMLNIDEFLYIRRRRPNSLTTSVETGMGSHIRNLVESKWTKAFLADRGSGNPSPHVRLEIEYTSTNFELCNLKTGLSEQARIKI